MTNEVVITIGRKKRGFKFTMLTLQLFSDHTGVEFSEMMDELGKRTLGSMVTLLWAANTVYTKGKNGDVSRYDVDDWISKMEQEDLQQIWDCFLYSSRNLIKQMPKREESKKK